MTAKSLFMVGALAAASLGIASAKTYDITLTAPAKAGATDLKAGEYKLKIEGSQAVFTDAQDAKSVTSVPVKVENSDKKFDFTSVESTDQNGVTNIHAIDLGNSKTRLTVGQ
jgi:hypothetical protein